MSTHDLLLQPESRSFGWDRGTPIDRLYIRKFLEYHRGTIKGEVAEFGDNRYGTMFGVEKTTSILTLPDGDLTKPWQLPNEAFDCILCTQVLNCVKDVHLGVCSLHQMLKPGGTVLATMHCISPKSNWDSIQWGHFWGIYPDAAREVFFKTFNHLPHLEVYGNLYAATSFLKGMALEELDEEMLLAEDQDYPVTVCIASTKLR